MARRERHAKVGGIVVARCRARLLVVLAGALTGCGGGAPLMHPAHTLPDGKVSFAAGTSGNFVLSGLARAEDGLDSAAATPSGATSPEERRRFVRGALARFAAAPGVAPFLAARVGLGSANEAGISYWGRSARLDVRHAFEWPEVALSLGLAGVGALSRPGDLPPEKVTGHEASLRSAELTSLRGYGFELPVVFGYRSAADVVTLWGGLRLGLERDDFDVRLVQAPDEAFASAGSATRLYGGGLLGFGIGLDPVQVSVELDAAYQSLSGALLTGGGELEQDVQGWSLTPAMAISAKF